MDTQHIVGGATRRNIFAASAALAVAGMAAVPPPSADAAILALGERIRANRKEYEARTEPYLGGAPEPPANAFRVSVLVAEGHRMAEELADMRATTLDALRVKAEVLMDYFCLNSDGSPSWVNHDDLMGWSLARDLIGRA